MRLCSNAACVHKLKYDGVDDGLLVLNGNYAVSHEVMNAFEVAFYVNGSTFTAFATCAQVAYEARYGTDYFRQRPHHVFTRARLGLFVAGFRQLLNWSAIDAVCPKCGPHPSVLIGDGTAMGVPMRMLQRMPDDERKVVEGVVAEGRAVDDMSFVRAANIAAPMYSLLVRFIRAPPACACPVGQVAPVHSKDEPPLTAAEADQLLQCFATTDDVRAKSLAPAIQFAIENAFKFDGLLSCDASLAHYLYPLVTNSVTFAAYEPAAHAALARDLLDADSFAGNPALMKRVRALVPWVANFFRDAGVDKVPEYARPSLDALATFAQALASWEQKYVVTSLPLHEREPKTLAALKASENEAEKAAAVAIERALEFEDRSSAEAISADLERGAWYGAGLRQRHRGLFDYAKAPHNMNLHRRSCIKEAPTSRAHSPGVFSVLCPCGYPVAMVLMRSCESPAYFADVLEHVPADGFPRFLLYDNGCNAARFAIAREPGNLSHTRVLVDRLHWKNHTRCSTAFRMYEFSVYDDAVKRIDSQRAEQ
jgi:hypothetical protein